jgi:hypothetical protein
MLRRITKSAMDTKALNGVFIEALCDYMQSIAQRIRGEIIGHLNDANVQNILKAGMKFGGAARRFAEKALKFAADFNPSMPTSRRPT